MLGIQGSIFSITLGIKKEHIETFHLAEMQDLHNLVRQFGEPEAENKTNRLIELLNKKPTNAESLIEYHEALLFILAYPDNQTILELAKTSLLKCGEWSKLWFDKSRSKDLKHLEESGLNGTTLNAKFSYGLTSHLATKYQKNIHLHSIEGDANRVREILQFSMVGIEKETLPHSMEDLMMWLTDEAEIDTKTSLEILLKAISFFGKTALVSQTIFEFLSVFISIDFDLTFSTRSFLAMETGKYFYQKNALQKKIDLPALFALPKPKIAKYKSAILIETARLSLLSLAKETDPITFANPTETTLYDLEKGLTYGLFHMLPANRLPIDTYVGYMAFRNGIPISYGGAWIVGNTAQIGINIYETFRGGESAMMLCQLMRLYHKEYNIHFFRVEPYQLGHDNEDGLKSGAFWFYYKLGFRPEEAKLKTVAESEWQKMQNKKNYRTPISTLKKLVQGYMGYFTSREFPIIDSGIISTWASDKIKTRFSGDRQLAASQSFSRMNSLLNLNYEEMNKWTKAEQNTYKSWCLFFYFSGEIPKIKKSEIAELIQMMKAKGSENEKTFVQLWQKNKFVTLLNNQITKEQDEHD